MSNYLSIKNAREHNLKNISLDLPRNRMIVFTGVSGSGKSSLAFDTIFMEGQRRYIASLSAYARQFIQNIDRPSVDKIDGLSPTVCIDQKSVGRNPRSTVGTITEIYDFLRLLFSRLGTPHCPNGHGPIHSQTAEVIIKQLYRERLNQTLLIMAPIIVDRKGEYRKELNEFREAGFIRILVNGKLRRLEEEITLARYEKHTLEIVLDRVVVTQENLPRITDSVYKSVDLTGGKVSFLNYNVLNQDEKVTRITYENKDYVITNIKNSCQTCGTGIKEMEPKMFSFNSPQDACSQCQGLGYVETFDPTLMVRDPNKSIFNGALAVLNDKGNVLYTRKGHSEILKIYHLYGINPDLPWQEVPINIRQHILTGKPSNTFLFKGKKKSKERKSTSFSILALLNKIYDRYRISHLRQFQRQQSCLECEGSGLGLVARYVTLNDRNIHSYNQMQIQELATTIGEADFSKFPEAIWKPIVKEIQERISFLINVGLGYLSLNRKANTLSGGEAQRIRLAAQVGSGLEGCLYVLDEPSIGLHAIDNQKLIKTLKRLQSQHNSLIVIEHDEETMLVADHIVEIGPGAGVHGGEVSFNGTPSDIFKHKVDNATIDYLIGRSNIALPLQTRKEPSVLTLHPIHRFNLKGLKIDIPLEIMTVLTGVSGSGKSTLFDVLSQTVSTALASPKESFDPEAKTKKIKSKKKNKPNKIIVGGITVTGLSQINKVIEINQKPIGRTPRSNPATYTDAWESIRDLFAQTKDAQLRGYGKSRFSFNLKGGRCEECQGSGVNRIETQFFSTIEVICEACDGQRFNRNTLSVSYKDKNIYDILEMTIEEAHKFFIAHPKVEKILRFLNEIGLSYMKLGQNSTTLSGGEAQRIKLASELSKNSSGNTLYLLDEPTTGLHFSDIEKLLSALHSLVDQGNSVVIIEHNYEVIKSADHIIEMGPQGGEGGGQIVFSGKMSDLPKSGTATGEVMKSYLKRQEKKENGYFLQKKNQLHFFPKRSTKPIISKPSQPNKKKKILSKTYAITIKGLRKHNLKNIDLNLPKNQLIVFTGVSGSGKSSIAMDSIHTEGQRKYLESLSTYARRFLGRLERPPMEAMENLSPTIAIDQKKGNPNPRSTIATQTEIYDNLRNLFAHVGIPHCSVCDEPLRKHSETMATKDILSQFLGKSVLVMAPICHQQDQGFLIQRKADLPKAVKAFKESGFLRLLINGEVIKIDQINSSWQSKMQEAFLIVDRVKVLPENEERIIAALEKAYQIGNKTACFLDYNDLSLEKMNYLWYTGYASCWKHNQTIKEKITPRHFSFNHHLGACTNCNGIGKATGWDEKDIMSSPHLPFPESLDKKLLSYFKDTLVQFHSILNKLNPKERKAISKPWLKLEKQEKRFILWGKPLLYQSGKGERDKKHWPGLYYKLLPVTEQDDEVIYHNATRKGIHSKYLAPLSQCPTCAGARLQTYLLKFKINGLGIDDVCGLSIKEAKKFFNELPDYLKKQSSALWQIARETVEEVTFRIEQMLNLGIDYLTLDRETGTLSGGELQRVRLSTQIGNQLHDVIYVLDEPTIGLHEHDNHKLIQVMQYLRDLGNTVLVIEHDAQLIKEADYIVDIGPGAGESGGQVTYAGPNQRSQLKKTSFFDYLNPPKKNQKNKIELDNKFIYPRKNFFPFISTDHHLRFTSLNQNNIHNLDLILPLNKLVGISGVSGSGKSSLLEVMEKLLEKKIHLPSSIKKNIKSSKKLNKEQKETTAEVSAWSEEKEMNFTIERIRVVDQSPVSLNKRSILISYMDIYSDVRKIFAGSKTSKARGYTISHFSFNSELGRCPKCYGLGEEEIEMHFISNVNIICEECQGKRFKHEVLDVFYNGKNIHEVLEMTFQEAEIFFYPFQFLQRKIVRMLEAGLGYLKLGFKTSLLSGGERQRLKIAYQLAMDNPLNTLYFLDEPTTGLHFRDIEKLIRLLEKLISAGGSVVTIEHNIEFLRSLDHIIDLGPGSGPRGGKLIAAGNPRRLQQKDFPKSITLKYL